jgi:hypothetical protein
VTCVRKALKCGLVTAALFILPWLTSIAYGNSSGPAPGTIRVEAADGAAAPEAVFLGLAFGSVTPGDLFYIDATGIHDDIAASLYLTNAPELTHYLRYFILKVSVYPEREDGVQPKTPSHDRMSPESGTYLTMQNSPVKFSLPGGSRYKVRIDSGSYYCLPAGAGRSYEPPHFYLTVEPD